MRGSDGKLCFREKERGKDWVYYIIKIMNEESDWDCNVEGGAVEGQVACVSREEVLQTLNEMKLKHEKPLDLWMYHSSWLLLVGQ